MSKEGKKHTFSFNNIIGVLIIIGMVIGVIRYFNINESERLFATHYESVELEYTNLRGAGNVNANLNKALSLYEEQDFIASASLFTKYLSKEPGDFAATYLSGVAFLENGQFNEAIDAFKKTRINSQEHYEDATWYLALSYLKGDEKENAKIILKELANASKNLRSKAAGRLLLEI